MKFLRILTLLISVTTCSASEEVNDALSDYAGDSHFGEDEMEESQRELNTGNIRSYLNHRMSGKGGKGGKGGSGSAPAYDASPVYETGGKGGKKDGKKGGKKGYDKSGKVGMGPTPAPAGDGTCGCEIDSVKLDFTMLPYNISVPISPNAAESEIGTVFIFNDPIFDLNLTVLDGTFVGGLCTKTQVTQNAGASTTIVGGGYCFFTYTVSNGNTSVTFNAAGEVFDVLGGTLSIEGGTGELSGSYGEVELTPVYQEESQTDFFLEASLYVGGASLFVPLF
jgi:hypothetical protein